MREPVAEVAPQCPMLVVVGSQDQVLDNDPAAYGARLPDPAALQVVQEARPGIYAKGGDYVMDQIPEGKEVIAQGGKAVAIDFAHDRSTTRLVAKIRQFGG